MADIFSDIGERLFGRPHLIEPAALLTHGKLTGQEIAALCDG